MSSPDLSEAEKRAVGLADQATLLVEGGDAKVSLMLSPCISYHTWLMMASGGLSHYSGSHPSSTR